MRLFLVLYNWHCSLCRDASMCLCFFMEERCLMSFYWLTGVRNPTVISLLTKALKLLDCVMLMVLNINLLLSSVHPSICSRKLHSRCVQNYKWLSRVYSQRLGLGIMLVLVTAFHVCVYFLLIKYGILFIFSKECHFVLFEPDFTHIELFQNHQ